MTPSVVGSVRNPYQVLADSVGSKQLAYRRSVLSFGSSFDWRTVCYPVDIAAVGWDLIDSEMW